APGPVERTTVDLEVSSPATSASYLRGITPPDLHGTTCPGAIELAVALRVVTEDGGLDEHWTATARQQEGGGASFTVDLKQQPVAGSLRVMPADGTRWDKTWFGFDTTLDATGAGSGSVYYGATRQASGVNEGFSASVALLDF